MYSNKWMKEMLDYTSSQNNAPFIWTLEQLQEHLESLNLVPTSTAPGVYQEHYTNLWGSTKDTYTPYTDEMFIPDVVYNSGLNKIGLNK